MLNFASTAALKQMPIARWKRSMSSRVAGGHTCKAGQNIMVGSLSHSAWQTLVNDQAALYAWRVLQ